MLDELKRLSLKKVRNRLIAGIILVVIILAVFGSSFYKLIKGPEDLFSLPVEKLQNSYTEGDIDVLIDVFAQYYSENDSGTENIIKDYYVVPIGEKEYFALEVKPDDFGIAKKIYDETYEYIIGAKEELTTSMKVTGTISRMNDELYDYYMDWFESSGLLADISAENMKDIALPYVLRTDYIGHFEYTFVYVVLAAVCIIFLYAVIILIKGLTGGYLSSVKKYIKSNEGLINTEKIESDYEHAPQVENIRIGEEWFYFFQGAKARIIKNTDIIWAYLEEITHRTNGIKTGVTKSLIIYTRDKKKHTVAMKSSSNVNTILSAFSNTQPHMVIGFNEDLKKCFQKDFDTFVRLPYMRETASSSEATDENL